MTSKKALEKKLAKLETIHEQLIGELTYLDCLMKLIGFAGGLSALKATAREYYQLDNNNNNKFE